MDEGRRQDAEREYARKKLPEWADADGILYPRHISLEQCSSQQTAQYKAKIISKGDNNELVDLTGGFGVDCYYIGRNFKRAVYVEQNEELCHIARHNYDILGFNQAEVVCGDAVGYLQAMPKVNLIYIDPARRDVHGQRTYAIEDCTPDITMLNTMLLEKADRVMVKLSPMFDWHKAVSDLKGVTEVHIVSVSNECKELLLILEKEDKPLRLICVNDDSRFIVEDALTATTAAEAVNETDASFLYEPNASIMKAGCFKQVAAQFGAEEISQNSHLFTSDKYIEDFPGRKFQILTISSMNKHELKEKFSDITKANITTRNFPMKPEELRKKLKLSDGGDLYLFATTTRMRKHKIFICKRK